MSGSTLLAHTRQEDVKARPRAARRNTGDQEEKEERVFWGEGGRGGTYGRKKQQKKWMEAVVGARVSAEFGCCQVAVSWEQRALGDAIPGWRDLSAV